MGISRCFHRDIKQIDWEIILGCAYVEIIVVEVASKVDSMKSPVNLFTISNLAGARSVITQRLGIKEIFIKDMATVE